MTNITTLKPLTNIPDSLRSIADEIESGLYDADSCTLILGVDIFHLGTFHDDDAGVKSIWDMTYGIHKLMARAVDEHE